MWSAWLCYDLMMLDELYVSALPNLADSLLHPPTGEAQGFQNQPHTRARRVISVPRTCCGELRNVHRAWPGCVRACVRVVAHSFTNRIWRKIGVADLNLNTQSTFLDFRAQRSQGGR